MRGPSRPVVAVAVATFALHAAVSGRYGFHSDELDVLAAGDHPAAGYPGLQPFTPLVGRAVTAVVGDHLWPLRLVAGAVHAVVVVVAAAIARELGGGSWAQRTTALAVATGVLFLGATSMFGVAAFDLLGWSVVLLLATRAVGRDDPRWWLPVGVVGGLALLNDRLAIFLALAVGIGLVCTPERRHHLRSPWVWGAVGIAVLLWLPNLRWESVHGGASATVDQQARRTGARTSGPLPFVFGQLLTFGPVLVPMVVAGLVWAWRRTSMRVLALAVVAAQCLLLLTDGRSGTAANVLVFAIAAGAVAIEQSWSAVARGRSLVVGALLVVALPLVPVTLPVLPVDTMLALKLDKPNDQFAEQLGWPELTDQVVAAIAALPPGERTGVRVLAGARQDAAALQWFGPARGLAADHVLSGHNAFAAWWPDGEPTGVVVAVHIEARYLAPYFDEVTTVATIENDRGVHNELRGAPVVICRGPRVSPEALRAAFTRLG